jgi:hypothetical protein
MTYKGTCYGCTCDEIVTKHPIDAEKYKGGHDPSWPRGRSDPWDFPGVDVCHLSPPLMRVFVLSFHCLIFYVMPCLYVAMIL